MRLVNTPKELSAWRQRLLEWRESDWRRGQEPGHVAPSYRARTVATGRLPLVRIDGRSLAPLLQETPRLLDEVVKSGVAAVDDLPRARHGGLDVLNRKQGCALPLRGLRLVFGHGPSVSDPRSTRSVSGSRTRRPAVCSWQVFRTPTPARSAHSAGSSTRPSTSCRSSVGLRIRWSATLRCASPWSCFACALICRRRLAASRTRPQSIVGVRSPSGSALQFCGTAMTRSRRPGRVLLTPTTPPQRWRVAVMNAMAQ
jgi:hypothetical protein